MDNYHLTYQGGEWKLKKGGTDRVIKNFETKKQGINYSTGYVKQCGGSLKIHKENGQIQEERTYPRSADPKKTKG